MNALHETLGVLLLDVLRVSWQAAALVLLILGAQWLLRNRISAAWRHALWGVLLLRLVLLWSVPAPFSVYSALPDGDAPAPAADMAEAPPIVLDPSNSAAPAPSGQAGVVLPIPKPPSLLTDQPRRAWPISALQAATVLWLSGAGLVLLVVFVQSRRMTARVAGRRLLTDPRILEVLEECKQEMGVSNWLPVVVTPQVGAPALLGVIRPRLLLPVGLIESASSDHLRHIFLHELAHLKRHDILTSWLFHLLLAVHWFNPVLWWAQRRITADRELACDARVLTVLGPDDRRGYGHTLLDQAQQTGRPVWCPGLAGVLEGKTRVERRIDMITTFRASSKRGAALAAAVFVVLGAVALTEAQDSAATDLYITPASIYAFLADNGGAMIAARITNTGPEKVVGHVAFYEGDPDAGGKLIGRGGLDIPAGGSGVEAIMWPVTSGEYTVYAVVDPDNSVAESNEDNNRAQRKIVSKMQPTFSMESVGDVLADKTIVPGRGLQALGIGDSKQDVLAALGAPEKGSTNDWLIYKDQYGLDFVLYKDGSELIGEMRFNPGFDGKTPGGAGFGDSLDLALQESGGALKHVKAAPEQTHGVTLGVDRVLYEQQHGEVTSAYKFIDANKGILYWADADKRITQIVVFRPKGESSDERVGKGRQLNERRDFPTTVFFFTAKDEVEAKDAGQLLDLLNEHIRGAGRTHHYRHDLVDGKPVGTICADDAEKFEEVIAQNPNVRLLASQECKDAEAFEKYLNMSKEERVSMFAAFLKNQW